MGDEQQQETAVQKLTATVAGVLAGVTLLAGIIGISSTSSSVLARIASSSPEEVSESAPVVKAQPQPKKQLAKVISAPHMQLPPVQGKSRIAIKANQGTWIDACADGRTVIRRYLAQSNTADLGFANVAVVRTGNAGGVEISVNGTATGPVGILGEVRVIQFDAQGFHFLEQGDPGTECGR